MSLYTKLYCGILVLTATVLGVGCPPEPEDAIAVSNSSLDFERSELPRFLEVWNDNPSVGAIEISVTPSASWIVVNTRNLSSAAPAREDGPFDKETVQVTLDRSQLSAGNHQGEIVFAASGIVTRTVQVLVTQDTNGTTSNLNVVNPVVTYTSPYLIDFSFALRDKDGASVVENPNRFTISARENAAPVASETGIHVQRGTARQLKVALVLDYTFSMQSTSGAIAAMEEAAENTLLPALNEDALVSVTEFHREDFRAMEVVPFTVDRAYTRDRIDAIQSEVVQGFSAASRMFDAVKDAAETFKGEAGSEESRYIIIFTDGNDTSSITSINSVVNLAVARDIRIYAINFGRDGVASDLQELTRRTEGVLFTAATISELDNAFQQIVRDLDGQYNLRWASLARSTTPVLPGFTLRLRGERVNFTAPEEFVPTRYTGNGVLEGKLRFVKSESETSTTVFLRADYVPRFIRQFRIYLSSDTPFTATAVDGDNDGLFGGWTMTSDEDPDNGGITLFFQSPDAPIGFGTFGPMLRITYDNLLEDDAPLFTNVFVDNSIYATTGGQSFVVEGYENTLPAE